MDVCKWMRHSEILSYLISHTFWICFLHYSKSLCGDNDFTVRYPIRRRRCEGKGKAVRGEMGGAIGCCWGADTATLSEGPDFFFGSQAGRLTCCSCPGNIQQWSEGSHRHQQNLFSFLPPPLSFLPLPPSQTLFILHFLFSFTPSLEQNLTTGTLLMSWLP